MIGTVLVLLVAILFLGELIAERARRRPIASAFEDARAFGDDGPRWTPSS